MANLVSRFFDVSEGKIIVGGADVRNIKKDVLMDNISFVFQNSHLIKGTILENVRMARPDASKEEVIKALEDACCMDIIEKMPDGINTVIGVAIFAETAALSQLWLFWVAPIVGAIIGAIIYKILEKED